LASLLKPLNFVSKYLTKLSRTWGILLPPSSLPLPTPGLNTCVGGLPIATLMSWTSYSCT
jgi:hypothetical protein